MLLVTAFNYKQQFCCLFHSNRKHEIAYWAKWEQNRIAQKFDVIIVLLTERRGRGRAIIPGSSRWTSASAVFCSAARAHSFEFLFTPPSLLHHADTYQTISTVISSDLSQLPTRCLWISMCHQSAKQHAVYQRLKGIVLSSLFPAAPAVQMSHESSLKKWVVSCYWDLPSPNLATCRGSWEGGACVCVWSCVRAICQIKLERGARTASARKPYWSLGFYCLHGTRASR